VDSIRARRERAALASLAVDDDGFRTALAEFNPALFIQSALPSPHLGFADGLQVIVRIMLLGLLRLDLPAQVCWGFLDRAAQAKPGRIAAPRAGLTECRAPQPRLAVCARQTAIPDILLNAALG
jgi:hypothetical protein